MAQLLPYLPKVWRIGLPLLKECVPSFNMHIYFKTRLRKNLKMWTYIAPIALVFGLFGGCAVRAPKSDPSHPRIDALLIRTQRDFDKSGLVFPFPVSSGSRIVVQLPESADKIISEGASALSLLEQHSDVVAQACIEVIKAKRIYRTDAFLGDNGIKVVTRLISCGPTANKENK